MDRRAKNAMLKPFNYLLQATVAVLSDFCSTTNKQMSRREPTDAFGRRIMTLRAVTPPSRLMKVPTVALSLSPPRARPLATEAQEPPQRPVLRTLAQTRNASAAAPRAAAPVKHSVAKQTEATGGEVDSRAARRRASVASSCCSASPDGLSHSNARRGSFLAASGPWDDAPAAAVAASWQAAARPPQATAPADAPAYGSPPPAVRAVSPPISARIAQAPSLPSATQHRPVSAALRALREAGVSPRLAAGALSSSNRHGDRREAAHASMMASVTSSVSSFAALPPALLLPLLESLQTRVLELEAETASLRSRTGVLLGAVEQLSASLASERGRADAAEAAVAALEDAAAAQPQERDRRRRSGGGAGSFAVGFAPFPAGREGSASIGGGYYEHQLQHGYEEEEGDYGGQQEDEAWPGTPPPKTPAPAARTAATQHGSPGGGDIDEEGSGYDAAQWLPPVTPGHPRAIPAETVPRSVARQQPPPSAKKVRLFDPQAASPASPVPSRIGSGLSATAAATVSNEGGSCYVSPASTLMTPSPSPSKGGSAASAASPPAVSGFKVSTKILSPAAAPQQTSCSSPDAATTALQADNARLAAEVEGLKEALATARASAASASEAAAHWERRAATLTRVTAALESALDLQGRSLQALLGDGGDADGSGEGKDGAAGEEQIDVAHSSFSHSQDTYETAGSRYASGSSSSSSRQRDDDGDNSGDRREHRQSSSEEEEHDAERPQEEWVPDSDQGSYEFDERSYSYAHGEEDGADESSVGHEQVREEDGEPLAGEVEDLPQHFDEEEEVWQQPESASGALGPRAGLPPLPGRRLS